MNDVAAQALEKAKKLREGKSEAKPAAKTAKKKTAAKKGGTTTKTRRTDIPWAKIVAMHEAGKTSKEISDALGYTNEKSDWPYSYTLGLLKRLRQGVESNGKKFTIKKRD